MDKFRQYGYMGVLGMVVVIGILAIIAIGTGGDDSDEVADTPTDEQSIEEALADLEEQLEEEAEAEPEVEVPDIELTDDGAFVCPEPDGSSPQVFAFPAEPPSCLEDGATYTATFDTNFGTIVAELDAERAPLTVNSFVYLARYHYYDGSTFHRIIENFVIQGGDPVGDPPGTGSPGYRFADELPADGEYQVGTLAMANAGPNTNGSQFFIISGSDGAALPPNFSLFGMVSEGLDVVETIQTLPTDGNDFPAEDLIVNTVVITQS